MEETKVEETCLSALILLHFFSLYSIFSRTANIFFLVVGEFSATLNPSIFNFQQLNIIISNNNKT